jgi:hypothetical protein
MKFASTGRNHHDIAFLFTLLQNMFNSLTKHMPKITSIAYGGEKKEKRRKLRSKMHSP